MGDFPDPTMMRARGLALTRLRSRGCSVPRCLAEEKLEKMDFTKFPKLDKKKMDNLEAGAYDLRRRCGSWLCRRP